MFLACIRWWIDRTNERTNERTQERRENVLFSFSSFTLLGILTPLIWLVSDNTLEKNERKNEILFICFLLLVFGQGSRWHNYTASPPVHGDWVAHSFSVSVFSCSLPLLTRHPILPVDDYQHFTSSRKLNTVVRWFHRCFAKVIPRESTENKSNQTDLAHEEPSIKVDISSNRCFYYSEDLNCQRLCRHRLPVPH